MEFEIFKNKKIVDGKIDLLSTYAKFNYEKMLIKDWIVIDEASNTSIDLISTIAYGSPDYLDLLIKFNRLNNPLYIPTGTIIMIPDFNSFVEHTSYVDLSKTTVSILAKQTAELQKLRSTSPSSKPAKASNYIKNSNGAYIF